MRGGSCRTIVHQQEEAWRAVVLASGAGVLGLPPVRGCTAGVAFSQVASRDCVLSQEHEMTEAKQ